MFPNFHPGRFLAVSFLVIILPVLVLAAVPRLESEVSAKAIASNASLLLTVKLFNAVAVTDPETAPLEPFFEIIATQKAESVQWSDSAPIVVTRWQYQLQPKRIGKLTIPTLTVATQDGAVKSQPVHIDVVEPDKASKDIKRVDNEAADIRIQAAAERKNPYVGEVMLLQVTVLRGSNILQSYLDKPSAGSAKIEPLGEPDNKTIYNGEERWMRSIFRFAITPLQAGEMEIKPVKVSGSSYGRIVQGRLNNNFYDPANDPFANYNNKLSNSRQSTDFAKSSGAIAVEVQEIPAAWTKPAGWWLPAQYITISQQFSGNNVRAGDAIKRKIRIDMLGATASALENMEERLRAGVDASKWKIYIDKPAIKTEYDDKYQMVKTTVAQEVSYVPLEAGTHEIPAFQLPWWSVREDTEYAAQLPAERIEVSANFGLNKSEKSVSAEEADEKPFNMKLWLASSFMFIASAAALSWWWLSHNRIMLDAIKRGKPVVRPWVKSVKAAVPERQKSYALIMTSSDPRQIINAVEAYMREVFDLPRTMRLPERAEWMGRFLDAADGRQFMQICHELEAASYGGGNMDIKEWKKLFFSLLGKAEKKYKGSAADSVTPPPLNP